MSKLDGNERWKSKMLLTEHQEQHDQRGQIPVSGRPGLEELTMIRDYIMFPHIIAMLQKGMEHIRVSRLPLKDLNIRCLEIFMLRTTDEYYDLKRSLKRRNIKVFTDETGDGILYHRYLCRGYEERFGIAREALRMEISNKMTQYIEELGEQLRAPKREG
ncbi:hypothetical protein ACX93W_04315 [Paenibacillus sp. CAU 1782]